MHLGAHLTFFFWSNHIPVTSANDVPHGIEVKERVGPSNAARTTVQMQFKLAADKNMGSDHQRLDKLVSHDDSFIVQWWSGISSLTLNKVPSKISLQLWYTHYCSFLDFFFLQCIFRGWERAQKSHMYHLHHLLFLAPQRKMCWVRNNNQGQLILHILVHPAVGFLPYSILQQNDW